MITTGVAGILKNHVDWIYLHIDMDVLETDQGQPNHLAVPGGLPVKIVEEAIRMVGGHFSIAGCGVSSYDPACDKGVERNINENICKKLS